MESPIELSKKVGSVETYLIKESMSVSDLLKKLNMSDKVFAVLVNGRATKLDQKIDSKSEITILPKIAGG